MADQLVIQDEDWRIIREHYLYPMIQHHCAPHTIRDITTYTGEWCLVSSVYRDCLRCGAIAPDAIMGMREFIKWSLNDEENKHR